MAAVRREPHGTMKPSSLMRLAVSIATNFIPDTLLLDASGVPTRRTAWPCFESRPREFAPSRPPLAAHYISENLIANAVSCPPSHKVNALSWAWHG